MNRQSLPAEIFVVLKEPSLRFPKGIHTPAELVNAWEQHGAIAFLNLRDFRPGWAGIVREFVADRQHYHRKNS